MITNAQIRRGADEWYGYHIDDYYEAREEAFQEYMLDTLDMPTELIERVKKLFPKFTIEEMDSDWFKQYVINDDNYADEWCDTYSLFDFKDEGDWLADEYESFIGSLQDQAYDEWRDRDI